MNKDESIRLEIESFETLLKIMRTSADDQARTIAAIHIHSFCYKRDQGDHMNEALLAAMSKIGDIKPPEE